MTELHTSDTLRHAGVPAARICADLVRIDELSAGALDNTKHWEVISLLYTDMSSGINSLARAFEVFNQVVADYSIPALQLLPRGGWFTPNACWQRANTERHVSGFFADTQTETRAFLSKLLIAKGAEKGLSLTGLRWGTGINWREYSGVHGDEYRSLAQELLVECGIGYNLKLHEVDLERAIEGYLASKMTQKNVA